MERKFRITVDGHAYTVTVEEMLPVAVTHETQPTPVASLPSTTPVAVAATHAARPTLAQQKSTSDGDVLATLAGVVEAVPVSVGDTVEKGQPVVIVEAMKMKSPMVAPRSGKVSAIAVSVGQGVDPGQVLASIS